MKKKAKDLKKGDEISIAGKRYKVEDIELSEIGKQGARKCRLVLVDKGGEKMIVIRPEDYPIDV